MLLFEDYIVLGGSAFLQQHLPALLHCLRLTLGVCVMCVHVYAVGKQTYVYIRTQDTTTSVLCLPPPSPKTRRTMAGGAWPSGAWAAWCG